MFMDGCRALGAVPLADYCGVLVLNLSYKGHQNKISSGRLPLNTKLRCQGNESKEVKLTSSEDLMSSLQDMLSDADPNENFPTRADDITSLGENIMLIENSDGQWLPTGQLEDLRGQIKRAEKNVLFLNQARINALKELDHILFGKMALQTEINGLELKLAETDARLFVATQEKMYVKFLEHELESLKMKMYSRDKFVGKILTSDCILQDAIDVTLFDELNALRVENALLKDDLKALNKKLHGVLLKEDCTSTIVKERSSLETELNSELEAAQINVSEPSSVKSECNRLWAKVENLQAVLDTTSECAKQDSTLFEQNFEFQSKIEMVEASLEDMKKSPAIYQQYDELLLQKVEMLEECLQIAYLEIRSHTLLYQKSLKEFQTAIEKLKEHNKKELEEHANDMPWGFWSHLLLMVDSWLIEKKISSSDGSLLREMIAKKDRQICEAYLACNWKNEHETITIFLKLTQPQTSEGFYIVHIAAEMAPVAKVHLNLWRLATSHYLYVDPIHIL